MDVRLKLAIGNLQLAIKQFKIKKIGGWVAISHRNRFSISRLVKISI